MKRGRIIIISGPSGAGKTTLYKRLLKSRRLQNVLVKSISATTRVNRSGEKHGRDYFFMSKKMFLYKRRAGHFLESQKVFNDYYGTPLKKVKENLNKGKSVLLSIDVKGARAVWQKHPDVLKIFIKTPSFAELKKRLKTRATEGFHALESRLKTAKAELKEACYYDYVIVNNNVNKAYRRLENILCSHLLKR